LDSFCDALSRLATDEALLDTTIGHLRARLASVRGAANTQQRQTRAAELRNQIERAKDNLTLLPRERIPAQLKRLDAPEQELAGVPAAAPPLADDAPADWADRVRDLLRSADQFGQWLRTLPAGRQRDVVQEAVLQAEVAFERRGRFLVPTDGVFLLDPACLGLDDALCPALHEVSCNG